MLGSVDRGAPLAEETLFRRVIFGRFWPGMALTGAVVSSQLVVFADGLLLGWLVHRTGDLLTPMSVHATANLIACAVLATQKLRP